MKNLTILTLASLSIMGVSMTSYAGERMPHMKMVHGGDSMRHLMDTNNDNSVSKDEYNSFRTKLFARADKNGDKILSQSEFAALGKIMEEQRKKAKEIAKQKRLNKKFGKLDANGDGKISEGEYSEKGERSFIRMDQNDDGVLNEQDRKKAKKFLKRKMERRSR